MMRWVPLVLLVACNDPSPQEAPKPKPGPVAVIDQAAERRAIDQLIDGWHGAASRADEKAYFDAFTEDAVFLGTDATERWDKAAFRKYAHPHFAKGKAWSFRAVRRDVMFGDDGQTAWFDEDLATPNLGPARGSGVVTKKGGHWLIAHYNLTITVPNERFKEVKALLDRPARKAKDDEDESDEEHDEEEATDEEADAGAKLPPGNIFDGRF